MCTYGSLCGHDLYVPRLSLSLALEEEKKKLKDLLEIELIRTGECRK